MSSINKEKTKELENICQDAIVITFTRGNPILCASENPLAGKPPDYPIFPLKNGDVCVATNFYNSGHTSPDCKIYLEKIYNCPYKRPKYNLK
jgi:hypothetical protein